MKTEIELSATYELHKGKPFRSLTLREPTGADYIRIGEPRIAVTLSNGGGYWVEQPAVIEAYLDRCIETDGGAAVLGVLSLGDVMKVKRALFHFFAQASVAAMSKPAAI